MWVVFLRALVRASMLLSVAGMTLPVCGADQLDFRTILETWEELASGFSEASGEFVSCHYQKSSGDAEVSPTEVTWKCRGECRLLWCETLKSGRWVGEVYSENDNYSFQLARSDRNRPWTLVQLVPGKGTGASASIRRMLDVNGVSCGLFPLALNVASAIELFKSPAIIVDSVTSTSDEMVALKFHVAEGQEDVARALDFHYRQGALTLDSRRGLAVVSYDLSMADGTHSVRRFTSSAPVESSSGDMPLLGTFSEFFRDAEGVEQKIGKMDVKSLEPGKRVPLNEFRLSAFGLPEPAGVVQSARVRYWWGIGAVGFVIAVVGAWVFVRNRPSRE